MKKQGMIVMVAVAMSAAVAGAAVLAQNQHNPANAPAIGQRAMAQERFAQAEADTPADGSRPELDVPYVPTPEEVVDKMLELTKVQKDDIVYDLGCGDGRIVITAAKKFGVRGVGVDIDPERIRESKENARQAGVADRVQFLQQDLFKTDISKATVVTLYLLPQINLRLRPTLFRQLKPGTRIASHAFNMGDWKPDQTVEVPDDGYNRTVYYWVLPAHVAGTWQWNRPGAAGEGHTSLQLQQTFQEISGALNNGGARTVITAAKLVGDRISFTVEQGAQGRTTTTTFTGRVSGNTIKGTIKDATGERPWEATRNAANLPSIEGTQAKDSTEQERV